MNSQNYCPEVKYSPTWSSSSPQGNSFDYSPNHHEITVYYYLITSKILAFRNDYLLFSSIPVTIVNTLKQNQAIENSIAWPFPGHLICLMTAI